MKQYPVRFALAGAATLALLLSGCAGLPGYPAAADTPVAQLVAGIDCQAPNLGNDWMVFPDDAVARTDLTASHPDAPEPGRVPAGFTPVAASLCTFFGNVDDAEGRWSAVTIETHEGDFTKLLVALAQPNDQPGVNQACTADMELVPELWLENAAGDAMRAAWPRNACGKTKPAARTALDALQLIDTTKLPLVLQVPRDALDAGCAMSTGTPEQALLFGTTGLQTYTTEIGQDPQPVTVPPAESPSYDGVDGASVCFYSVDPIIEPDTSEFTDIDGNPLGDAALDSMMHLRSGTFENATTLPADAAALLPAAASALEAPACAIEPTRFAVLWPERAGTRLDAPIHVELDGCQRLIIPATSPLVPDPALLAALTA